MKNTMNGWGRLYGLATLLWASTQAVPAQEAPVDDIYTFTLNNIDGKEVSLSQYRGRVLLVVNVASRCGFTPQYRELESLYLQYKDRGLTVLGFPANNFLRQEPGTNEEIKSFCSTKYNVTFPMFAKLSVRGKDQHPLYAWLTNNPALGKNKISWNFNKFLIGRDGRPRAHFGSQDSPEGKKIIAAIEAALAQPTPTK